MAAAGGGAIVNLGSVSWMIGQGGMPCYTTAKSAVAGLTRALARDLGPKNIPGNCVVPGWIMTRSEGRRVGKGVVSTFSHRGSRYHLQTTNTHRTEMYNSHT